MKLGQTLRLQFIGISNNFIHPMHVHGGLFEVGIGSYFGNDG